MPRRPFLAGFRYGLGLWLARLLGLAACLLAACLLVVALNLLDILLRWLGWY